MNKILVTGGAGFIGSAFINKQLTEVILVDNITYAGSMDRITRDVDHYEVDIADAAALRGVIQGNADITHVVHFAAESHVDNSILNPGMFIRTNVNGTANLLNLCMRYLPNLEKFVHVSTDEVYGSLGLGDLAFTEEAQIKPNSPYSASKASSDLIALSYYSTYNYPVVVTNCSNNFGPYQHPEKLIPKVIHNIANGTVIPVYGKGENIRDWIFLDDHVRGIEAVMHNGTPGERYNIGGDNEISNIKLIKYISDIMKKVFDQPEAIINFVEDRKGHDFRYAINSSKLKKLGWLITGSFKSNMESTIRWNLNNKNKIEKLQYFES